MVFWKKNIRLLIILITCSCINICVDEIIDIQKIFRKTYPGVTAMNFFINVIVMCKVRDLNS